MHVSVRSHLATGVALVGAGAIALSPVQPSLPETDIPTVSSAAVQLAAQPNPIALWSDVLAAAIHNAGGLGEEVLSDPLPVLRQILKNQFGYFQTLGNAGKGIIEGLAEYASPDNPFGLQAGIRDAFAQFEQGEIAAGVSTLTSTLVMGPLISGIGLPLLQSGLLQVPGTIAQNLADAVKALFDNANAVPLLTAALGPIIAPINAFGASVQEFVDALVAGQIIDAITAVVNVPARIVGAVLNGYTDELGNTLPGLLTVSDNPFGAGLVQALFVNIPRAIAAAIGAEPTATLKTGVLDEVSSPTNEVAATVTVSLTETDSAPGDVAPATEAGAPEPAGKPVRVTDEAPADEDLAEGSTEESAVAEPAEESTGVPAAEDPAGDETDVTDEQPAADEDDAPAADGGDSVGDTAGPDESDSAASGNDNASESSDE